MRSSRLCLLLLGTVLLARLVPGDMYYERRRPPSKTIHVHHFDAGSSNHNHKHGHGSDGSSLIELLLLSSLLGGGGGLFGGQNQAIGIPVQAPVLNPGLIGR
ncbi:hypothetical protein BsWGS_26390 [Bradybaena similaris]